ncbi:MAG: NAD(P)/FAD-dependent oxidoreductase [Clostridia bacterium]|nr:NAD(P)/FAD-dependent oxidoreductase [Clostridia bacterium]
MFYDVVIIGAGISGAMCAYKLSKYKLNIAVLEAGIDVAAGSTRANSAIIHAGYDAKEGTLKAKLNVKGCEMMQELTDALGVHYKNCGSLVVGFDDYDREQIEILKKRGETNGVKGLRILDKRELHKMEPNVSPSAVCALFAPTAGIVCPYDLAFALSENAATNGAEFYFNFKVSSIEKTDNGYAVSDGNDTVCGKYIISATGIYCDEIAKMIDDPLPFEIIPRRGEYMLLDKAEGKTTQRTLFVTPNENGKGILVTPTADGNIIVGPNANVVDEKGDTSVTIEGLEEISEGARRLVPNINLGAMITSFAGVRPTPSTRDFYIQESEKCKNFIHVAGIESPGLASSPAIGDYVVDILKKCGLKLVEKPDYIPTRSKEGNFKLFYDMTDKERKAAIEKNPLYAKVVCRCENITEGDVVNAIHRPIPAYTSDMVKRRTRSGMGRCQGGFCNTKVAEIIARELGIPVDQVQKFGKNSNILCGKTK